MKMTCAELEVRLESLIDGSLDNRRRAACEHHLRSCETCARLVELATLPQPAGGEEGEPLAEGVLQRTSGPVCDRAELLLAARLGGERGGAEASLVDLHLAHCPRCAALARALHALARDLPRMAELAPETGFVRQVLAASLPLAVRLRRWRRQTWPVWVRRPRFAMELAYALTLVFVLLFNIPGTPLAAMPRQALDLARTSPLDALEEPVRERLAAWGDSAGARRLEAELARQRAAAGQIRDRAPELLAASRERVRTFFADLASWLENAAEDSTSRTEEPTEETS